MNTLRAEQQQSFDHVYSYLDWQCNLTIQAKPNSYRHTSICATLGPISRDEEIIEQLIKAGVNIFRLNLSHGSANYHAETIQKIRFANSNYSKKIGRLHATAIAIDTKGPEITTGIVDGGYSLEIEIQKGDIVKLTTDKSYSDKCTSKLIYIDYDNLTKFIEPGCRVFLKHGLIILRCIGIAVNTVTCVVDIGGRFGSHQIVNLPEVPVDIPHVSEKDKVDIQFALDQEVEMLFASYVRSVDAITEIRQLLGEKGKNMCVIAKLEDMQAIDNLEEIIKGSDGVMVARGDLGIEISQEKIAIAQKKIIALSNIYGKPVINAYNLMVTMTKKPRPTRAEISDVFNAVLDGVDCVLLSSETSKGEYPIESIKNLDQICRAAETAVCDRQTLNNLMKLELPPIEASHAMAIAAVEASGKCLASVIITCTESGRSAHLLSRYRPRCPVLAVTRNYATAKRILLYKSIVPLIYETPRDSDWSQDLENRVQFAVKYAEGQGFIKYKDNIIIVTVSKPNVGFTNVLRNVIYLGSQQKYIY